MDVLEVAGCPQGSLQTVEYIKERGPEELVVKTSDEDCVKVLRLVLPLFQYVVVDVWREGDKHAVRARRARS
ncbi:hypothetical protein [Pyrobaculum ferrireducens]|uniref:Uncharacterized protein n=1 Tax=Pyrobaculum ferrireducens TaxID=1104324 RepID=G7VGL6_9CREN|nr:hypothetical protein [Pyrobaculum ferrireducens]AET33116.1 hypothetical protein P186_1702 [Pyrobaculum ferrireducens]